MKVLGISAYYHDSAAALIKDDTIMAAAQEERFTRTKHDASFPKHAIRYCLEHKKIKLSDIDYVTFYEKPFLTFERIFETFLTVAPRGITNFPRAMPLWLKDKLFLKSKLLKELSNILGAPFPEEKLLFTEHHQSHAASAYYPSPFDEAIVLTMDGVGEWATTSISVAKGAQLDLKKELHFPHSLGLLYSAFTYFCGFKVNSGEYKLMGLAPYGMPRFVELIKSHLLDIKEDGSFQLRMEYFNYHTGMTMTSSKFSKLFGQKARKAEQDIEQIHMDLAASIQSVLEEIILLICKDIAQKYQIKNLCLSGGVALNCVANGKIKQSGLFDHIWVQPASGDAGSSIGAALYTSYQLAKLPKIPSSEDSMKGSLLGPCFSDQEIERSLQKLGAVYQKFSTQDEMIDHSATLLSQGKYLAWFQGRMEFGPRALGNRSILADPRNIKTQKELNLKIKYRESFRPFAPSVLLEQVEQWFDWTGPSPYMLMVAQVKKDKCFEQDASLKALDKLYQKRSAIPAVTHVNYSSRLQTVDDQTNPLYHKLIERFGQYTGHPILVNTSFNIRGEPIVCRPEDAFRCFMGTELDYLVIGSFLLDKKKQLVTQKHYQHKFDLD